MTEIEVVLILRRHYESCFPKVCRNCGRRFGNLKEYMLTTQPIGPPVSYDAEFGDWNTVRPAGSLAYANCSCGTTLALSTDGLPLSTRQALLRWLQAECQRLPAKPAQVLERLRTEIRRQVLRAPDPGDASSDTP